MKFALPQLLWLLLLVPLAAWCLWLAGRRNRRLLEHFLHPRLLDSLTEGVSHARRRWRAVLWLGALACLMIAAARPQWGYHWVEVKRRGVDIIVALDTSRSMLAEDIKPNRLERAKLAAMDLAQLAGSDRVGLVALAGSAFLQCPLTLDVEAFRQSLMILDTEIIPQGGTALAEAIDTARAAFTNAGESHKIIVLFSDGEDHEQGVLEAATAAARQGIKLFTIGVGTPEGEELRMPGPGGRRETLRDEAGAPVRTRLEERLLYEAAKAGGGFYLRLAGAGTMNILYEKGIAPLPKAEQTARMVREYHERYHWPLGLALLFLIIEILIPDRPMPKTWFNHRWLGSAAALAWVCTLALGAPPAPAASAAAARRDLDRGYNKTARETYEQLLQQSPGDPRLRYNLGVACFRDRDYERAAREFESATLAPDNLDLQERAFYNAASAHYYLGNADPNLQNKKKAWQTATNHLGNALRLNPQNQDAAHNWEAIRRKLELLEQQQQQPQQEQQQNQDQNQEQPENSSPQQSQESDSTDPSRQPDQPPEQDQAQKPEKNAQEQNQAPQPSQEKPADSTADSQDAAPTVRMTPDQARQLLEAAKVEEKVLPFLPPEITDPRKRPPRPTKNW